MSTMRDRSVLEHIIRYYLMTVFWTVGLHRRMPNNEEPLKL